MQPLVWSPWTLFAAVGSVLVGQVQVLFETQKAGGGLGTIAQAYRDRFLSLMIVVGLDAFGGLAFALALIVLGATQKWFTSIVDENVWLGWMIIGAFGPLISDFTFAGSVVKGRFEPKLARQKPTEDELEKRSKDGARFRDTAWRLRAEAVRSIERRVWVLVQRNLIGESIRLRSTYQGLLETDYARARELAGCVRTLREAGESLPEGALKALAEIDRCEDIQEVMVINLDWLLNELIDGRAWEAVEAICGDARE